VISKLKEVDAYREQQKEEYRILMGLCIVNRLLAEIDNIGTPEVMIYYIWVIV
jgi:hypothetical protein